MAQPQVLLVSSEAQLSRARELFPRFEHQYINGGDYATLQGRRVVAMGQMLATFAVGYAAEVKTLPDDFPADLTESQALAWAKANAQIYSDSAPVVSAASHNDVEALGKVEQAADVPPSAVSLQPETVLAPPQDAEPDDVPSDDDFPPDALLERPLGFPASPEGYSSPPQPPDQPADLWGAEESLPEMPPECYPEALREYIVAEAEVMGCDPGMLALYCIAICAGCVTDEIRVQVKSASDRWQESARVWCMVVGDSGLTMKSPSLDAAISHAWKLERELRLSGSQALKDYGVECQIYEAQKAEYVKKRAKGDVAEMPAEPPLPLAERLIIGNATLEAISDVLLQQGARGALVVADELLGVISSMNQYKGGKGSDRQDWLEMWNGGPHPIDRKGRAVLIKNWAVSIIGGTQPEAIARIGQDLETDGLLQRFTVYLPRHSTRGMEHEISPEPRRRYHAVLDRLHKLTAAPDLRPVQFAPDAQAIVLQAREWVFQTAKASWLSAGLRSHLAKWPSMYARLCLTYAAIEAADEQHASIQPTISAEIAAQVWDMMRSTLWQHAQHFYLNLLPGESPSRAAVRQIAGLILAERMEEIDARTITRRCSLYRAAQPFARREAIANLCDFGWLTPTGGKSLITGLPTQYTVNGAVHDLFKTVAAMERQDRASRTQSWNEKREAKAGREPGAD